MNKTTASIIGFLLFITGAIAIILSLVGLQLTILAPLESMGQGFAFLVKILMTVIGIIVIYVARTDTE